MTDASFASYNKSFWPMWFANNPLSKTEISHQQWQDFLDHNLVVNGSGLHVIDYAHMSNADVKLLDDYIVKMSAINIDNYNRHEQLAYWLNLYNALMVKTIKTYYPISSVQEINISPGLFSIGPFGASLINVTNTSLTLDDINNRIIRPIWSDPRTHYALNDGTIGGPNLSQTAYHSASLDEQLNQAATGYINALRGVQVIEEKLIVSKIYEWYAEDFGGNESDIIDHIKQFAQEPLKSQLKKINKIDGYVYNWHINALIKP